MCPGHRQVGFFNVPGEAQVVPNIVNGSNPASNRFPLIFYELTQTRLNTSTLWFIL